MTEDKSPTQSARDWKQKIADELKKLLWIFLYLWVVFALLSIHETIIRAQHHLDYGEHTFAIINAFIFAKVLLIGDHFQLGTRYKDKALVYPVLYKSFVFSLLLIGFHVIERMIVGLIGGMNFEQSFAAIGGGRLWSILSMSALSFVMLIPFFAFRELGRTIGEGELRALFFGQKAKDGS